MNFSILFWNIWFENQIKGAENSSKILAELQRLVDTHQPDFIGLSEVLQARNTDAPFVFDYLKRHCGYEYSFCAPTPLNNDWLIGPGFCSKSKPKIIKAIPVCKDSYAEHNGYEGSELKIIEAQMPLGKKDINIMIAHPVYLRPYTLKDHYQYTKSLERLIRADDFSNNTILAGDFNEPGFMPKAFKNRVRDVMHLRTGSIRDTTWRHNASSKTLIRANLDQLYWTKNSKFSLNSFEVLKTDASDHRPLLAKFTYEKS